LAKGRRAKRPGKRSGSQAPGASM